MDRIRIARWRIVRTALVAGALTAALVGNGARTALAVDQWETTITVTCSDVAAPLGIIADGNLRDKQGRAMLLNGDKHFALFIANCTDNATATYTFTTKHEPVEALITWYVWDMSTRLLVMNCSTYVLVPMPVIAQSSGSGCDPYGSSTVTITATN